MKQYIEAKIDGEWCTVDRMDITEKAVFTIYNDNGDPTDYPIDDYELRITQYQDLSGQKMSEVKVEVLNDLPADVLESMISKYMNEGFSIQDSQVQWYQGKIEGVYVFVKYVSRFDG